MISERLALTTTGTAGVVALAAALERAQKAQAGLVKGGGGAAGIVSSRVDEINAQGAAKFQLARQGAVNKLVLERVKQEGQGAAGALKVKEKELALEKEHVRLQATRERQSGLSTRAAGSVAARKGASGAGGGNAAIQALLDGKGASGVLEALGVDELAIGVAGAAAAAGVAAVVGAAKFGQAVIEAQAFREDVSRGLEVILKSKAKADEVLAQSSKTADFLGRDRSAVAGQFVDLLAKGFDPQKVDEITRRLADLSTVDPRANLDGLSRAIGQIAGKGRLQGDEILQLAEAGLETGDVYASLAKSMGKTVPEIIKLQTAGKISASEGIQGILDAIAGQTGNQSAGLAANKKSLEDLTGLIGRLKAIPGNVLFDLEVGPGLDATKTKMREIIAFFDAGSASGKEVRQVLGDTFNALAEGLFGIDPSKTGGITTTLQAIVDTVKGSKDEIRAFGSGVASIGSAFAWVGSVIGKISALKGALQDFAGPTLSSIANVGGIWGYILLSPLIAARAALKAFAPEFYEAGANLMSSLGAGIASTASSVIDAVTSAVGGAITWAKKLLGIASPSKVFMEIGAYTSAGFVAGIAQNDNAVARAAGNMAQAAAGGASSGASAAGQGGSAAGAGGTGASPSGAGVYIASLTIQVSGARSDAEAESQGRAAARGFRAELDLHLPGALRKLAA